MPTLPAPLPFTPGEDDLPVKGVEAAYAVLPVDARAVPSDQAPAREALLEANVEMFLVWQEWVSYAAAQADVTTATDTHLDGLAEDRNRPRVPREIGDDEALRDRVLAPLAVVTPTAILAAANKWLGPYAAIECQLIEPHVDGTFCGDGTGETGWFSGPVDPEFPTRLYDTRPQAHPGGAWICGDNAGGLFVLRIPKLTELDDGFFVTDGANHLDAGGNQIDVGAFVNDGTNDTTPFSYESLLTTEEIIQSLINEVDLLTGQGVRWILVEDPTLT